MQKQMKRAVVVAALGWFAGAAGAETYRCQQADGSISFQQAPCPLSELVLPAAVAPTQPAPRAAPIAPKPLPIPVKPAAPQTTAVVPVQPAPKADTAAAPAEDFVKPTRRKREVLDLTAQMERCRADVAGFAEKSAPVYAAWTRRHGAVMAEYHSLLAAKVRAGRRGETTLPTQACTDEFLAKVEVLARIPDGRFNTVEKTWQVFIGALMTADRATALSCLAGAAETRWKQRVERMGDEDLRRIGASIRGLKVQWGDDYEKEGLVADTDNRVVGIAFRNVNEEWKITELGAGPAPGFVAP